MKNIIIITGIILFSALFSAKLFAQGSHSKHKKHSNITNSASTKPNIYAEYFQLKDAFVRSNFKAIKLEAQVFEKSGHNNKIKQLAKEIYLAKNIAAAQIVLSTISDEYIALAKETKADQAIYNALPDCCKYR